MTSPASQKLSASRAAAVSFLALMFVAPALWIGWSLAEESALAETIRNRTVLLAALRERLSSQQPGSVDAAWPASATRIFLPGATPAIAAATLQRTVTDTIQAAGARVVETALIPAAAAQEEPGRVDLRVSFAAEIVSLQRVLYELESGVPLLLLRALDVQAPGRSEIREDESPALQVVMLIGGYWEAEAP